MSPALAGALVGLLGGSGLALAVAGARARRIRLDDRLAPYLRPSGAGHASPRGGAARRPLPVLGRLLEPVLADAQRLVARLGSPSAVLRARLERAGSRETVEEFRAGQVVWGVVGLAAGLALGLALVVARPVAVPALVVLVALGGLTGALARDRRLSHQVRRREERVLAELPTVSELVALAVAAGEGPLGALERVVRTTRGELSRELERLLADARSGTPVVAALEALAARTGVPPLARFADGLAVAIERGTPLADVLRAQAQDVRDAGRRALLEAGGRKEVAMMVPVVFLVLPVTVVFAVVPSLLVLQVGL